MTIEIRPASSRPVQPPVQFSLRGLLKVVTALCVLLGAFSYVRREWLPIALAQMLVVGSLVVMLWGFLSGRVVMALAGLSVLAGVALLLGLLQTPRGGRASACSNNLRQIAMALAAYESEHGTLPPAYFVDASGRPTHSWRAIILPQLGENALYQRYRFDEPWDGPHNRTLHNAICKLYHCPSDGPAAGGVSETSYVAVVGPATVWPGATSQAVAGIPDGTPQTLLLVEVRNSGIHWLEPRDLDFSKMPLKVNLSTRGGPGSNHKGCCHTVRCDGSVTKLRDDTPPTVLRALLTKAGHETNVAVWPNEQ